MTANPIDVTFAWCSTFNSWRIPKLFHASRPPALFQYHLGRALIANGSYLTGTGVLDEDLEDPEVGSLAPRVLTAVGSSDIAYVSSHGRMDGGGTYYLRLRAGEWAPTTTAHSGVPRILVLDTCNVVTKNIDAHNSAWLQQGLPTPAMILGFVGAATDGYAACARGRAFAEYLGRGWPFKDSWFNAIRASQPQGQRDRCIAIAFGDTQATADATLHSASLNPLPARTVANFCSWEQK